MGCGARKTTMASGSAVVVFCLWYDGGKFFKWRKTVTTITLDTKLDGQVQSIAQQMGTSVDGITNDILAKYINRYREEALEDLELLAIAKQRENEPSVRVSLDDL